ncbi:hypothetical protein [Bdellovibrio bacteriovorus]|nr:hypothetical protein [Bdellovibrio bacteriovorus]
MTPQMMLDDALSNSDYNRAIRFLASVPALQTADNMLECAKNPQLAFDVLKFVSGAKNIQKIIDIAAENPRFARIIVEDIPHARTLNTLKRAIDGDLAWANKYKELFGLDELMFNKLVKKSGGNKKESTANSIL